MRPLPSPATPCVTTAESSLACACASGHIKDVQVSGSHFQNIGIVNCASVNIIRPTSTFCMGTDIAINDFSLDCASECGRLRPSPFC